VSGFSELGIPFADFKTAEEVRFPHGTLCKKFSVARALREADCIINLPKLKTHSQMYMTCAVKNLFGCIPGLRKAQFHFKMQKKEDFALMLLDLYRYIQPAITIVDAVIAMEGQGPGSGDPRHLGFIAASTDAVALDAVCADIIGFRPDAIPYIKIAHQKGWGIADLSMIDVIGDARERFKKKDFKLPPVDHSMGFRVPLPSWVLKTFFTPRPVVVKKKCVMCNECYTICPAAPKAISKRKNLPPLFHYHTCIRCFCCQEICPQKAIKIKPSLLSFILG
jgi:Pyruvate/2-oxoacid:ferredoxin oxidoreductase delta subunit